jgi:endonuclease/exonuclease/phosphatase family metal-dependent hydrolase
MRPLALTSVGGRRSLGVLLTAAVVLGLVLTSLVAQPAAAAKKSKYKPHKVKVTAISTGSVTVEAKARKARTWQLFAATTKKAVSAAHVRSATRSPVSRLPQVTLSGLRPTSEPYYYRIAASDGHKTRYSKIRSVYLRPATPTALRVETPTGGGLSVMWDEAGPAGTFTVEQASDASFTQDRRTYVVKGSAHQLTPYGLRKGGDYWFRVRAANGPVASGFSGAATTAAPAPGVPVRLLTYNLLFAGTTKVGGTPASPWSKRRVAAAKLVGSASPGVIAVQEGNSLVAKGVRQVDSVAAELNSGGDDYTVAGTERDGTRTGPYVLYRTSQYAPVGAGGRWELGDGRYAAYQQLRDKRSGADFLAVSVHLTSGKGAAKDAARKRETRSLLDQAGDLGAKQGVPVVFAGDFNAHAGKNYAFDPTTLFAAEHTPDAIDVAATLVNAKYNSANKYQPKPLLGSFNIDHIYATPGVAVTKWSMLLDLDGQGRFDGTIPSDHNPLVADLEIPAPVTSS